MEQDSNEIKLQPFLISTAPLIEFTMWPFGSPGYEVYEIEFQANIDLFFLCVHFRCQRDKFYLQAQSYLLLQYAAFD